MSSDIPMHEKIFIVLEKDKELRFEVETNDVYVQLASGSAEIFGSQLVNTKYYKIASNSKVAIFTWYGCTINIYGKAKNVYKSDNPAMNYYMNLHAGLDEMREYALNQASRGPRVVIAGPHGIGKSTLCKILANYANRQDFCPMLVDLDSLNNEISLPGTMAQLPIIDGLDIDGCFDLDEALIYHYGHTSPDANVDLYNKIVQKMALDLNVKSQISEVCNSSGVIINTCGSTQTENYQALLNIITAFEVNLVVVLEHQLLYENLLRDVSKFAKVLCLTRPSGILDILKKQKDPSMDVNKFFYGPQCNIYPHAFYVKFNEIQIFRMAKKEELSSKLSSAVVAVPITSSLRYQVLSTSYAQFKNDDITQTNISGFFIINEVNMKNETLTVLSTHPRQEFKNNVLLMIDGLKYQDV